MRLYYEITTTKVFCFILFFFFCFIANAQIQALFNNKTQLETDRWNWIQLRLEELLVTPYKSMYVLPVHWTSLLMPLWGILILTILPAGVDYDNVESKFQLSFKTKVLQSFFLW
jgi:phospholipase A1